MKLQRFSAYLCLLLLMPVLFGCAVKPVRKTAPPGGYQVTDNKGADLTLSQKPQRIVSLTIASDEILLELVPVSRIAALTYLVDNPAISNATESARQVPAKIRASVEAVIAMQPDLVLAPDWLPEELSRTLRDTGLNVYVFTAGQSIAEVQQNIRDIAQAVGEPGKGEEILARMDATLREVAEKTEKIPEQKRPIVARVTTMGGSGGAGTSFDDICRYAGVRNAGALAGLSATGTLTNEQILRIDPDLFLIPAWDYTQKTDLQRLRQQIENDPSLQTVKAIKNRRLIQISDKYLFCTSQYIVEGVRQLAEAAYPDLWGSAGIAPEK